MTGTATADTLEVTRLRLVLARLARRIRQEAGQGTTSSQLSALSTIGRAGPMRLGALAEHERISKPTLTRIVAALEEAGHVERQPDPEDGRCTRVALTPGGQRLLAATRDRADAYLAGRLAALPAGERARVAAAVPALERVLEVGE